MTRRLATAVLAVMLVAGCSNLPAEDPLEPPVREAPADLQPLAIHVHQLGSQRENARDEWDYYNMPGYTGTLRREFVRQLQRAGYTVVVGRDQPRDCVAVIQAQWPRHSTGTATLVLETDDGQPVTTVSVEIPAIYDEDGVEHLEAHGAVALIHAMSESPSLRRFAARFPARSELIMAR